MLLNLAIVKRLSDISPGLFRGDPHFTEKVINERNILFNKKNISNFQPLVLNLLKYLDVTGIFPLCTIRSR